jgi:hypothetical protein
MHLHQNVGKLTLHCHTRDFRVAGAKNRKKRVSEGGGQVWIWTKLTLTPALTDAKMLSGCGEGEGGGREPQPTPSPFQPPPPPSTQQPPLTLSDWAGMKRVG